jgi:hypothetical protein
MEELIAIIVNMIVGWMSDKKPTPPPRLMQNPPPVPPNPQNPQNFRPVSNNTTARRWVDPRLAKQVKPIGPPRLKARMQMGKFQGQPKKIAPPPLPRLPGKVVAKEVAKSSPQAVPPAARPASLNASAIQQLIRSRPATLRTIMLLSEVIRPPLSLRNSNREMI